MIVPEEFYRKRTVRFFFDTSVKIFSDTCKRPAVLAGLIPILFLSLFYFYPLGGIFFRSFFSGDGFSVSTILKIFHSSRMFGIIGFTIWQAFLSTLLTLVVALPCAWVMGTFEFRGKRMIMMVATLPFVLPTIVVAAAFQALVGKNGLIGAVGLEESLLLILIAHLFYNFSIILRITSGFLASIGNEMSEAARMLGASPFHVFRTVTLPLLRPAIFAGAMLVFIFCFSSFGVVLILGGPSYSTIEVEIYRQAAHLFNLPVASTLALFQICFTFLLMWVYTHLHKKNAQFMPESDRTTLRTPTSIFEKGAVGACVLFILLFCLTPVAALVLKSIWHGENFSLIYYRELFMNSSGSIFYVSPVDAMGNSLLFACSTLAMALVVGGCAAFIIQSAKGRMGDVLDSLFMLPLSTSAVTLGFGMIITLDKPPLNIRTSMMLIPIVHTLVAFPFVVRSVLPALRSIPSSLKEAATLLGASPRRVLLYIELPIAARALSVGAVFAFTVSLGEFGATVFAARPEFTTMPVTIYKYLGQPGTMNYGQAMAVSSLLMLVTAAGFLLIEKIRKNSGREGF